MEPPSHSAVRPFTSYPTEIRELIYTYLFEDGFWVVPPNNTNNPPKPIPAFGYPPVKPGCSSKADAILRTCKSIYDEGRPHFVRGLTLVVHTSYGDDVCSMSFIPSYVMSGCHRVCVTVNLIDCFPFGTGAEPLHTRRPRGNDGYLQIPHLYERMPNLSSFSIKCYNPGHRHWPPLTPKKWRERISRHTRFMFTPEITEYPNVKFTCTHTHEFYFPKSHNPVSGGPFTSSMCFTDDLYRAAAGSITLNKDCFDGLVYSPVGTHTMTTDVPGTWETTTQPEDPDTTEDSFDKQGWNFLGYQKIIVEPSIEPNIDNTLPEPS